MARTTPKKAATLPEQKEKYVPTEAVTLDLDSYERPDRLPPFRVKLGGRMYELVDPSDQDVRELMKAYDMADTNIEGAIGLMLHDDDREEFLANKLPGGVLQKLMEDYTRHFGLEDQMEKAQAMAAAGQLPQRGRNGQG